MKANTVRLLAGGLAATILMTNMATMPVFANEINTPDAIETEMTVDTCADAEEAATEAESTDEAAAEAESTDVAAAETESTEEAAAEAESTDEGATETESTEETFAETADAEEVEAAESKAADTVETTENQNTEEAQGEAEDSFVKENDTEEMNDAQDSAKAQESSDETVAREAVAEESAAEKAEEAQGEKAQKKDIAADLLTDEEADADEPLLGAAPEEAKKEVKTEAGSETHALTIEEAEQEAKRIENEVTTLGDVMNLLIRQDTTKSLPELKKAAEQAQTEGEGAESKVVAKVYSLMREAYGKAIDKVFSNIPVINFVSDSLKGLVLDMIGLGADSLDSKTKTTKDYADEINKNIDDAKYEITRSIETVGSIRDYGTRLDAFTSSATQMAQEMEKIQEDNELSENAKAVRIAELLGSSSEWAPGKSNIFSQMSFASQSMRSKAQEGPKADTKSRNLFELFYDYNKETSMFSGEAMDKANTAIQKRVNQYVANCNVVSEALRAHEKVANLTADEVAKLDDETRAIYNRIKSDKKKIHAQMKNIIETFTGNKDSKLDNMKYGILDAANDHYSRNRLTYLEKDGDKFNEVKLASDLYLLRSENYSTETLKNMSAVSGDQVRKLQQHVNSLGMTMSEYLEKMGFDMKSILEAGKKTSLSTLKDNCDCRTYRRSQYCDDYYYGMNMTEKGATEKDTKYRSTTNTSSGKHTVEFENKDELLAVFMTSDKAAEVANEQKALRAEESARRQAEEIKQWDKEQDELAEHMDAIHHQPVNQTPESSSSPFMNVLKKIFPFF